MTFNDLQDYLPITSLFKYGFWATACKTLRPMLWDRRPVCLSWLSVTLVYCGQTVRWIRMPLGTEIGLDPGHIVLDGNPAPSTEWAKQPSLLFGSCLLRPNGWMDQDTTWYRGRPSPRRHCVRWGFSFPHGKGKGTAAPTFWSMSIVSKRSPISATAEFFFVYSCAATDARSVCGAERCRLTWKHAQCERPLTRSFTHNQWQNCMSKGWNRPSSPPPKKKFIWAFIRYDTIQNEKCWSTALNQNIEN